MIETKLPSSVSKLRELQRRDAAKIKNTKTVLSIVLERWFEEKRVFTEEDLIEGMNVSGADPLHSPWAVRQAWYEGIFTRHPVTGVINEREN